jgi:hypothetical protein
MEDLNERDLFAMLALCGLLASGARDADILSHTSYTYADAMILARQTKGENHGS